MSSGADGGEAGDEEGWYPGKHLKEWKAKKRAQREGRERDSQSETPASPAAASSSSATNVAVQEDTGVDDVLRDVTLTPGGAVVAGGSASAGGAAAGGGASPPTTAAATGAGAGQDDDSDGVTVPAAASAALLYGSVDGGSLVTDSPRVSAVSPKSPQRQEETGGGGNVSALADAAGQEEDVEEGEKDEGWYPGKLIKVAKKKRAQAKEKVKAHVHERQEHRREQREHEEQLRQSEAGGGSGGDKPKRWVPGQLLQEKAKVLAERRDQFRARLHRKRELRSRLGTTGGTVAELHVRVLELKEVQATRPYVECSVEGVEARGPICRPTQVLVSSEESEGLPGADEVAFTFAVTDITTDAFLFVMDEYTVRHKGNCVGHVILPLVRYMGMTEALPPCQEWVEIYPMPTHSENLYDKHVGGVEGNPGSAMMKPPRSLGFLKLEVELVLSQPLYKLYFLSEPFADPQGEEEHAIKDEDGDVELQPSVIKKNMHRIGQAMKPSPLVATAFTYPYSIGLLAFNFYLCFLSRPWQLPFVFLGIMLLYGAYAHHRRDLTASVILWEEDVGPDPMPQTAVGKLQKVKKVIGTLQIATGKVASFLERSQNVWTWEDPHVTAVVLGALAAGAVLVSILLAIIPVSVVAFMLLTLPVAGIVAKGKLDADAAASGRTDKSEGVAPSSAATDGAAAADANNDGGATESKAEMPLAVKYVSNFFSRVPDRLEVEHRYISEQAVQSTETIPVQRTDRASSTLRDPATEAAIEKSKLL